MCDHGESGCQPGISPLKDRRREAECKELGEEAQRDSGRGRPGGSRSQPSAGLEAWVAVVAGPQVWGPREGVGRGGAPLSSPDARAPAGRRARTSDCLLNPLECPFLPLFFGPLCLTDSFTGICVVINTCRVGPGHVFAFQISTDLGQSHRGCPSPSPLVLEESRKVVCAGAVHTCVPMCFVDVMEGQIAEERTPDCLVSSESLL